MGGALVFRLSLMMFLQFFMWGAWWVTLGAYMNQDRIGLGALIFMAYLSQPIAAMFSPFFLGIVADRFFSSQVVVGVLHLLGAGFLVAVPIFGEMDGGSTLFITFIILHMLCYMPTIGLTNAIAFTSMTNPEKQFPVVRVWGTIGWIISNVVVGILFAWLLVEQSPQHTVWPFYLAVGTGLVLGLYSFTLPHTPAPMRGEPVDIRKILGLDAVKYLSSKPFWVFLSASLLLCIPLAGYYTYGPGFMDDMEMGREVMGIDVAETAWLGTGQVMELIFMLLMPLAFARLGVKWMLLVGMGSWVARYVLFALGAPDQVFWMIWAGILFHGLAYDFFFVTGMVYVEKKAHPQIRAQAQGFLVTMTLGVGMFIGMIAMGYGLFNWMIHPLEGQERLDAYTMFWMIPAGLALAVMIFFGLFFRERPEIDSAAAAEEAESPQIGSEAPETQETGH